MKPELSTFFFPPQNFRLIAAALWAALFCAALSSDSCAADVEDPLNDGVRSKISGYTAIEGGQIQKGHYKGMALGDEFNHLWLGHSYLNLAVTSTVNKHLTILSSIEGRLWYNTVPFSINPDAQEGFPKQNFEFYFPNAAGTLSFGNTRDVSLSLTVGRFEYKYDAQSQNLGEYLFRTGTYPGYVITNFDVPLARLAGMKASVMLWDVVRQDLLFTTMRDVRPYYDLSITYIAEASIGKAVSAGAGISFDNCVSAEITENSVLKDYFKNGYLKGPGDTGYYTFRGTKLMARAAIDPQKFFGGASFLGPKDLTVYGEAVVLGLKDYPASNTIDSTRKHNPYGYDTITKRVPVMFGINLPTHQFFSYCLVPAALAFALEPVQGNKATRTLGFGLPGIALGVGSWLLDRHFNSNSRLDRISLEAEWYGCPYPDNYYSQTAGGGYPIPTDLQTAGLTERDNMDDNWKWSLNVKKTVYSKSEFIMQVARDHLRTEMQLKKYTDYGSTLVRKNSWYWMAKMKFRW